MPLRFEDDFLKKLEYLHVVSKRAFAGQNRADRLARKRGRGLEFADHRQYSAGDDFRHIDWKAYQRLNRLLLRLFDEEQDLPIYLFLDASRSMIEPAKFDQARRIVAALCYIGLAHLDRVTILPFGAGLHDETVPGRGKGRIFRVFDMLEQMETTGDTNLRGAFTQFASRTRQSGLAVVVSDFLDPNGFETGLKLLASMGHDVFVVHVASQSDRDPGSLGEVRFVDAETGELRDVEVTPALARGLRRRVADARRGARALLRALQPRLPAGRCRGAVRADHSLDLPQGTVSRMSFSAMAAWQAILLVAAAGAAAVWLFRLKIRPPRVSVPSLLLWRRVFDQARELTWWERVRRAVSLAATVALAIAARAGRHAAGPAARRRLARPDADRPRLVLVDARRGAAAGRAGTAPCVRRARSRRRRAARRSPWRRPPTASSKDRRPTWR